MIRATDLVKTFDGYRALDGLTLHVPRGAVYGLVGPNGAGKTTFIRCLTGSYIPDSGRVAVEGKPVFDDPAVKCRLGSIPDDLYFFGSASINDMLRFYRGIYRRFDMERFRKLGEVFPLDRKRPIRKFSKGMQKQAAFWLTCCLGADVLILDEPVDGLDPVMRRQVWSIIMGDVAERSQTVLVSSHNLRELEDVCDHVGILHKGRLLLERSLADIQGSVMKLQIVPAEGCGLPEGLKILHESAAGRMRTLIVRGSAEEIGALAAASTPVYYELIPLSLEEIFIYELGGVDHAVKEIVL